MSSIENDYKILKNLKFKLDEYMSFGETKVEIRSVELFDFIKKHKPFSDEFKNQIEFNRFLRRVENEGFLKQIIPNYSVDKSNPKFFQWKFFSEVKTISLNEINSSYLLSNHKNYNSKRIYIAENGEKLRSNQELLIYNYTLKHKELDVRYEHPLVIDKETIIPDFTIKNTNNNKKFIWEHFGMTNNSEYLDKITNKLEWYRNNGYQTIDKGGKFIYTYYVNENSFIKEIKKNIDFILGKKPIAPIVLIENKNLKEGEVFEKLKTVEVFVFGSCFFEKKISSEEGVGKGGYAAVINIDDAEKRVIKGALKNTKQTRMYIIGIIESLKILKEKCEVTIYTNNGYIIDTINKKWFEKWLSGSKKKMKNMDLWGQFNDYLTKLNHKIIVKHFNEASKKDSIILVERLARDEANKTHEEYDTEYSNNTTLDLPKENGVFVYSKCEKHIGEMAYYGIDINTKQTLFKTNYKVGTKNVGEFLAIIHALAAFKSLKKPLNYIYCNNDIVINWVKNKKCNTKLFMSEENGLILSHVKRAEEWLSKNIYETEIKTDKSVSELIFKQI